MTFELQYTDTKSNARAGLITGLQTGTKERRKYGKRNEVED